MICSLCWRGCGDEAFPININESPASFVTRSLVEQWRTRLSQVGLDESRITLELTPASINNIHATGFNPVKSLGLAGLRLHLAIDDFGIEPFSLLALQEFKMDSVKIDRDPIRGGSREHRPGFLPHMAAAGLVASGSMPNCSLIVPSTAW